MIVVVAPPAGLIVDGCEGARRRAPDVVEAATEAPMEEG